MELLGVVVAGGAVAAGSGALLGRLLRVALARMRRGVVLGPGRCEAGLVLVWVPAVVVTVVGAADPRWLPAWLGLGVLAVAGTATDVVHARLPDALTLPAVPAALALLVPLGPSAVGRGAVGALLLLAAHAAVHLALPGALGGGDVKLAAGLGAPLAAGSWASLVAVPVLAAAGLAVAALALRRRSLPFGPALLGAAWTVTAVAALGAERAAVVIA